MGRTAEALRHKERLPGGHNFLLMEDIDPVGGHMVVHTEMGEAVPHTVVLEVCNPVAAVDSRQIVEGTMGLVDTGPVDTVLVLAGVGIGLDSQVVLDLEVGNPAAVGSSLDSQVEVDLRELILSVSLFLRVKIDDLRAPYCP